jgi:hypothetical protein
MTFYLDEFRGYPYTNSTVSYRTVGVFRWVLDKTMSKKSLAVGTGAMVFSPLVDMVAVVVQ